ncbi:MAG: DUF3857 domain-containing protein [Flavobacterium sp.]|uniref:DUF3857 domain-containing protein n=1 Tax=Flavobacterium sp. TaxID=239 RepID=UPI001201909E|nr:DUF3857 domain-containing protein [Flavobacterium sp.]RZJ66478.1 MAG: DUF3857 domain-containing protein [Flavobacterium sp.]
MRVCVSLILVGILILTNFSGFAQTREIGKVTIGELEQKRHDNDTSAVAAYLFKRTKVKYGRDGQGYIEVITETQAKIKIYDKKGYDYANYEDYFFAFGGDKITVKEAATYNLVDGKIEKTKMKSESEFETKVTKGLRSKKFTLPNVREGSIIEYRVIKRSGGISKLRDFYFQHEIPVDYAEYQVNLPERFKYNKIVSGHLKPKLVENTAYIAGEGTQMVSVYSIEDVPALKEEEYVTNIDNFRSHVQCELSAVEDSYGIVRNVSSDWPLIVKAIYEDEDFGTQIEKTGYFEDDIKPILANAKTPSEKINAIFAFVQSRMSWNEYKGFTCDDGVKAAYKNKVGNAAEINLMLVSMLRYAGLEASPILVSTRENGISYFPSVMAFDYVICGVWDEKGQVLLDATHKYSRPGILPERAINWFGRMVSKNGAYKDIELIPEKPSNEVITLLAALDKNGGMKGKLRNNFFDYNAMRYREKYSGLSKDLCAELTEKRFNGIQISDYEIKDRDDLTKPVEESYTFEHSNVADVMGDKMYFSPMLFLGLERNPFVQEERQYPVDFVFPYKDKFIISIKLPENYVVESVPQETNLGTETNIGIFKYSILPKGDHVQIVVQYEISTAIVPEDGYEILKEFFSQMISKQQQKIVLKKV